MLIKKVERKKLKRGSEAVENILIIGIVVALLVTAFYPSVSGLIGNVMNGLNVWVTNMTNSLFS